MTIPERSYLVCATPRSGSTLLCDLLDQTGVAGHPEEYFEALRHSGLPRRAARVLRSQPARQHRRAAGLPRDARPGVDVPNQLWQPESYDRYLAWALEQGTTPNGVFGAKLMWGYLGDFATLLRGIEGMAGLPVPSSSTRAFPDLRYVRITRAGQDPPGGVPLARGADAGVAARARRAHDGSDRSGVLLPRDQLPGPPAHGARCVLGRVLPRARSTSRSPSTYEELAEAHEPVVRRVLDAYRRRAPGRAETSRGRG